MSIELKAESAVAQLIQAGGVSFPIYTGVATEERVIPHVSAFCQAADPHPVVPGNYNVRVEIAVVTNANDSDRDGHNALAKQVFDAVYIVGLAAALTGFEDDFTVLGVPPTAGSRTEHDEDTGGWRSIIELNFMAAEADLT